MASQSSDSCCRVSHSKECIGGVAICGHTAVFFDVLGKQLD